MIKKTSLPSAKSLQTKLNKQLDKNKQLLSENKELARQNKKLVREIEKAPVSFKLSKPEYQMLISLLKQAIQVPHQLIKETPAEASLKKVEPQADDENKVPESSQVENQQEPEHKTAQVALDVVVEDSSKDAKEPLAEDIDLPEEPEPEEDQSIPEPEVDEETKTSEEADEQLKPVEESDRTSQEESEAPDETDAHALDVETDTDDEEIDDLDGLFADEPDSTQAPVEPDKDALENDGTAEVERPEPEPETQKVEDKEAKKTVEVQGATESEATSTDNEQTASSSAEQAFDDLVNTKDLNLNFDDTDGSDDLDDLFGGDGGDDGLSLDTNLVSAPESQATPTQTPVEPASKPIDTGSLDPKKFDDGSDDSLLGLDDFI